MADVDMQHPAPRFALVGCTNFVVSLVAFYLCYHYLPLDRIAAALYLPVAGQAGEAVGAEGAVANVLAYFAGMLNSFWLNRWWAFRATDGGIVGQGVRFVIVNAVSLILGTVIMFVLVDRLHFPELAVWLPLAGLITVTNYLGFRLWAFARPGVPDVVVEARMSAGLRLIVNADDFGMTEDVNRGIVEAHERGIVTSASIMATGPAFEHAVTLAKSHPALDVGVHLTLTEQRPLTGAAAASLVGQDGRFPPHLVQFAGRHLRGKVRLAEVRAELDAQIRKVRDAGVAVSHLDGHQHVHVLPGIAAVVAELAAKYGIGAVRYPAERVSAYMLRNLHDLRRLAEQVVLGMVCALSPLKSLRRSDSFVGFYFGGRLDEASLATVLGRLPARGTVELMCHPGGDDARADEGYWQYSWSAERAALTSPRIRALIAARGAQLVSYRDV